MGFFIKRRDIIRLRRPPAQNGGLRGAGTPDDWMDVEIQEIKTRRWSEDDVVFHDTVSGWNQAST